MLASCLLVVHNTGRGCEDDVSELTRWQKLYDPFLEICQANIESWGDDTGLVETEDGISGVPSRGVDLFLPAIQLDDNLSRSVVVNLFKFADVT
jgi:hypothetical protein